MCQERGSKKGFAHQDEGARGKAAPRPLGLAVQLLLCIVTEGHYGRRYFKEILTDTDKHIPQKLVYSFDPRSPDIPSLSLFSFLPHKHFSNFLSCYLVGFTQEKKIGIFEIASNNNKEENGN